MSEQATAIGDVVLAAQGLTKRFSEGGLDVRRVRVSHRNRVGLLCTGADQEADLEVVQEGSETTLQIEGLVLGNRERAGDAGRRIRGVGRAFLIDDDRAPVAAAAGIGDEVEVHADVFEQVPLDGEEAGFDVDLCSLNCYNLRSNYLLKMIRRLAN